MQHIDDVQLQAFLDGELSADACRNLEAHLAGCPACCARLDGCQCLCDNLRSLAPQDDLFRSEGEFWACLAGRLTQPCSTTWPWLTTLPPVLLGSVGLALNVLLSLILVSYALTGLGIVTSPGTALASWLPIALGAPALAPVYGALGWSQSAIAERLTGAWEFMGAASQDLLVFGFLLLLVGAVLGTVLVLHFSWFYFSRSRRAR
jgi:anti-sigma factor RsiW